MDTAIFGGGCFWCLEAIYNRINGVSKVVSGYAGGHSPNSTYEQVSTGHTGHAEVIRIAYDPSVINFQDLLEIFFKAHDPTTINRQGADMGSQYRSIILYTDNTQKTIADKFIANLNESKVFQHPVITEIKALEAFYPAETYHQEYYQRNTEQPYCRAVIEPKLAKLFKA